MVTLAYDHQSHSFATMQEMYRFLVDNQVITEIGEIYSDELTEQQKMRLYAAQNKPILKNLSHNTPMLSGIERG